MSPYEFLSTVLVDEFDVSTDVIKPSATLSDLGLDSLSTFELIRELEEEFDVVFSDEHANFKTLAEAASIVESLIRSDGA